MPVLFPSIKPAERTYSPPAWPVTKTRSQSGVTSKRLWGSRPSDATMGLRFKALSGDKAADIVNAWNATKGGIDSLILPTAIFSGVSERLIQIILPTTGSLLWTFADAPGIDFVGPVWADVQVSLIGELRTS